MTKTLTITQAAKVLNVSDKTIRRWIDTGKLNAEKVDRKWYVHVDLDIDQDVDQPDVQDTDQANVQDLKARLLQADFEIQHLTELVEEKTDQTQHLRSELAERNRQIESLTQSLDHAHQLLGLAQKNIASLTEQLDTSRAVIEDMRNRPWWRRLFYKDVR